MIVWIKHLYEVCILFVVQSLLQYLLVLLNSCTYVLIMQYFSKIYCNPLFRCGSKGTTF